MRSLKELKKQCLDEGLLSTGNKKQLAERLENHFSGKGSEYSRKAVVKRKASLAIELEDMPKIIFYKSGDNPVVEHIPIDIWKKIFTIANRLRLLLQLRETCKYFYKIATLMLLEYANTYFGVRDIYSIDMYLALRTKERFQDRQFLKRILKGVFHIKRKYTLKKGKVYSQDKANDVCAEILYRFGSCQGLIKKAEMIEESNKRLRKKRKLTQEGQRKRLKEIRNTIKQYTNDVTITSDFFVELKSYSNRAIMYAHDISHDLLRYAIISYVKKEKKTDVYCKFMDQVINKFQ